MCNSIYFCSLALLPCTTTKSCKQVAGPTTPPHMHTCICMGEITVAEAATNDPNKKFIMLGCP